MGILYLPHSDSGSQKPKHRCQLAIIILAILIGPLTQFYVPDPILGWAGRLGKHPQLPTAVAKLLKRQHGIFTHCNLVFREEDRWEIDHIVPLCKGGTSHCSNLQLLHRHCHDTKTISDGSIGCTSDKGQVIEEPDEAKVSCPVLKTSGSREGIA